MVKMSQDNSIKIIAVGDIMLGDQAIKIGHGVNSVIKKNGSNYILEKVKKYFENGDVLFGNLESILSEKNMNKDSLKSSKLRGKSCSVKILKDAGFNILSLANNHSLEHGKESLDDTIELLKKNKINYIGVNEYYRKPLILNIKSKKVALFNYCLIKDPTSYISVTNEYEILKDIKEYHDKADITIVSLHWGTEFINYPSKDQIKLAHRIIDCGADIILGHHPHVLQGIEYYKNRLIAYSLGNFVFDMTVGTSQQSMILNINILDDEIKIDPIPVRIDSSYRPNPVPHSSIEIYDNDKINVLLQKSIEDYTVESKRIKNIIGQQRRTYFLTHLYRYPPAYSTQFIMKGLKARRDNKKGLSDE